MQEALLAVTDPMNLIRDPRHLCMEQRVGVMIYNSNSWVEIPMYQTVGHHYARLLVNKWKNGKQ